VGFKADASGTNLMYFVPQTLKGFCKQSTKNHGALMAPFDASFVKAAVLRARFSRRVSIVATIRAEAAEAAWLT
jgi:hypothetical protein